MANDGLAGVPAQDDVNETALRVLNLLFILNSATTPLSTDQIVSDSDLGYGSANRASDLKKFKRDREKLAEHGVIVKEVRQSGSRRDEESGWTIDRANTYAALGVIGPKDADMLLRAIDDRLGRKEIPYRKALLDIRSRLCELVDPQPGNTDRRAREQGGADGIVDAMWSAFALKRKIRFAYRDAQGRESTRTLAIWGMFVQRGHGYYVGLDEQTGGIRTFRADRITRAWRPTGSYTIPGWFDIRDQLFLPFDLAGGMTTPVQFSFPGGIAQGEIDALTRGRGEIARDRRNERWLWSIKVSDIDAAAQFALAHAQMGMRPEQPKRLVDAWTGTIRKAVAAHA